MRSIAVLEPGKTGIVEVPKPSPGPYEALVKTEIAFICNATDRKLVAGHFPGIGADRYPLLLGHESVGVVEAVGPKVRSFAVGDRVIGGLLLKTGAPRFGSGWGGDSEYVLAADADAMRADGAADAAHGYDEVFKIMRKVPADISVEAAGLLCTWREVYAGFSDFHLSAGDDILVFGAGPVGLSFCVFAKLLGLGWVGVVDMKAEKRAKALAMGADAAFAPDDPALKGLAASRGKPLDAVIDAVGHESVINAGLPLIRLAGSICVYGVLAAPTLTLRKDEGPYNFNLYMHQWPTRDAERAAQEPLIDWIRSGKLRAEDFVTAAYGFTDIGAALAATEAPGALKTLLDFRGRP
jgi:threonine dehydrogenase-like Zn-dependent dehydrogenase